jgi:cephalosporin hydroxylase
MNVKTEDELNELKDFRNLVAHGNYIIIKDEDVRRLKNMNRRIRGYIKRLEQI